MEQYTAKDLLLTTKDELLRIERKLIRLSELTDIGKDRNIDSVRYGVLPVNTSKKSQVACVINWNNRTIKGIINNLLERTGLYIYGREIGYVLKDKDGICYIDNAEYSPVIRNENQDEFGHLFDELLSDEFIKGFLITNSFYSVQGQKQNSISFLPSFIDIDNVSGVEEKPAFRYYVADDMALLYSSMCDEIVSDKMLRDLLDTPFNADLFNEYQRKVIESSPMLGKEIVIPSFCEKSGRVSFDVEEDDNELRLIRRNNN